MRMKTSFLTINNKHEKLFFEFNLSRIIQPLCNLIQFSKSKNFNFVC